MQQFDIVIYELYKKRLGALMCARLNGIAQFRNACRSNQM